jgi:hypothetical protein
MARGGGREKGTWKCRTCSRFNRPTMDECRDCGSAKPDPPAPKPRRSKPRVTERSKAAKERERASGVGSNGLRKGMTEKEKRLARGKALRCTPLANDIERSVQQRIAKAKEEEERANA